MIRGLIESLVEQEFRKTAKQVCTTFGRWQPPTKGHQVVLNKILSLSKQTGSTPMVFLSRSYNENNPLTFETRFRYLKSQVPNLSVLDKPEIKNPFQMVEYLLDIGTQRVIFVCGSDRFQDFKESFGRYGQNVIVQQAGSRRSDQSSGVESVSGTNVRQMALSGDLKNFQKSLLGNPTDSEALKLLNEIRKFHGADPI